MRLKKTDFDYFLGLGLVKNLNTKSIKKNFGGIKFNKTQC